MQRLQGRTWKWLVIMVAAVVIGGNQHLLCTQQPANLVQVPDVWKQPQANGFAWYRCLVKIPTSWQGRPLQLFLEPVDDARELSIEGVRVTTQGAFPPEYRSGLGAAELVAIPANAVRPGAWNQITLRVFFRDGRSQFNVAAPALFAGDEALHLKGKWERFVGEQPAWTTADTVAVAARYEKIESAAEVRAALKKLPNESGPLSVAKTQEQLRVAEDLNLNVALSEPQIGQPLSLKFDARGRMWVLQYLQYPNPAGLQVVSRDKYLRTVYDKIPPAPPNHFPGRDKITIHEDSDGDGVFDQHRTFLEGLSIATSFAFDRDGVWVLNPPYLLFYPDRDHNDVPDGPPEVHLSGFGLEDTHSVVNNLRWGPDGWLYAAQGSTVTGNVVRPGIKDDKPVRSMGQLIWRYHPQRREYEIFAEGGGNAFGVEFDSQGRVFSGHNGGDTRGFHYVQGGYYLKGFGKHGPLSNPYAFGYFPHMRHHSVPRFTHAFVIYEGGSLPPAYDGQILAVAPLQSHVVRSSITPLGSTFQTKDLGHPFESQDPWVRPVDIQVGPDGAVYIADFYEQRIDHASHFQGRVHRSSGRIYRLQAKGAEKTPAFDLTTADAHQLIETLQHPNKWFRQTALRLIGERRDRALLGPLRDEIRRPDNRFALDCLWALNRIEDLSEGDAEEFLGHADPAVRLWTVRLLGDRGAVSDRLASQLTELAGTDPSVHVRSQLACSARRLSSKQSLPILARLMQREVDVQDPHLPLLLWWGIETCLREDADGVLELLAQPAVWDQKIVREAILERLMRRFATRGTQPDLLRCARLLDQAPSDEHAAILLKGFEQAFQGRSMISLPPPLIAALQRRGGGSLSLQLRQKDPQAIESALRQLRDSQGPTAQRIELVQILGQTGPPEAWPVLTKMLGAQRPAELETACLNALQAFNVPEIGPQVLECFARLQPSSRETALLLLASRAAWAQQLLAAVEEKQIAVEDVPRHVAQRLLLLTDASLRARVNKIWNLSETSDVKQLDEVVLRYMDEIDQGSGNPYEGKRLYESNCGKCHLLYGQGGQVGPDLTSFKRDDLRSMLRSIVNPSLEIREGFENYVLQLEDGRTLNGFIADQDQRVVVVRSVDGQTTVVERARIEEMAAIKRSVMPDGLLNAYTSRQVRDLFAYLRSTQPLP